MPVEKADEARRKDVPSNSLNSRNKQRKQHIDPDFLRSEYGRQEGLRELQSLLLLEVPETDFEISQVLRNSIGTNYTSLLREGGLLAMSLRSNSRDVDDAPSPHRSQSRDSTMSLAARGINLAVSMMSGILKLAPLPTWPVADQQSNRPVASSSISAGLIITLPLTALEDEISRLQQRTIKDELCLQVHTESDGDSDIDIQNLVQVLTSLLQRNIVATLKNTLLSIHAYWISYSEFRIKFMENNGWDAICMALSRNLSNLIAPCESEQWEELDIVCFLISLITESSVTADDVTDALDANYDVNTAYAIRNTAILRNIIELLHVAPLSHVSAHTLTMLVRINPASAVAIQMIGGIEILRNIVQRYLFGMEDNGQFPFASMLNSLLVRMNIILANSSKNHIMKWYIENVNNFCLKYHSPTSITSNNDFKCHNCESECSAFECLHESCCSENVYQLCRECDRVFHKSMNKRNHIRLPMQHASREIIPGSISIDQLELFVLMLQYLRLMLDDYRYRNQDIPEYILVMLLQSLRLWITRSKGICFYVMWTHKQLGDKHLAYVHYISNSLSKQQLFQSDSKLEDEPPEDMMFCAERVIITSLLHCLCRFIIYTPTSRKVIVSRISQLRSYGFEAMLVTLFTDSYSTSRYCLTNGDKQFVIWLLREYIVTAVSHAPSHVAPLLRWFIWLLRCPNGKEEKAPSKPPLKGSDPIVNVNAWTLNNVMLERDLQKQDIIIPAPLPSARVSISANARMMVYQELRVLLGGSDWEPLAGVTSLVSAKVLSLGCLDSGDASTALHFRIPISSYILRFHLVRLGAVEAVVENLFGNLCNAKLKVILMKSDNISTVKDITDAEIEDWWCGLGLLAALVTPNEIAKDTLESCFDIVKLVRILLPLLENSNKYYFHVSALTSLLQELCVNGGRVSAPNAPFLHYSKLSLLNASRVVDDASVMFKTRYQVHSISDHSNSLTYLSPTYFVRSTAVSAISQCMIPLPMYRREAKLAKQRTKSSMTLESMLDHRLRGSVDIEDGNDDVSTRGSLSRQSFHNLASLLTHSPPPSVTSELRPSVIYEDSKTMDDVCIGESASIPLLPALQWGLSHNLELLMKLFYENLAIRANVLEQYDPKQSNNKSSLHAQALRQQLQMFVIKPHSSYVSPVSALVLRSAEAAEVLFAVSITLGQAQQLRIITFLTELIIVNPNNADLLMKCDIIIPFCKCVFNLTDEGRMAYSHFLSQIIKHAISQRSLDILLSVARNVYNTDTLQYLRSNPLPPASGLSIAFQDNSTIDDIGCQLLYIMGVAVEQPVPSTFTHFSHRCAVDNNLLLPAIERLPQAKVGFSTAMWLKLGCLGSTPISTLMQYVIHDQRSPDSNASTIDIFYRIVNKNSSMVHDDIGSSASHDGDEYRCLQLCISFHRATNQRASNDTNSLSRWDAAVDTTFQRNMQEVDYFGVDSGIAGALAKYAVPDIVVDLDWKEFSDWHLLCISITSDYVKCSVDGIDYQTMYWSTLGYVELATTNDAFEQPVNLPSNYFYPQLTKDVKIKCSVGGILSEVAGFESGVDNISQWCEDDENELLSDQRLFREAETLQCFHELIGGFAGCIGEIVILEGVVESSVMKTFYANGINGEALSTLPLKKIVSFNPSLVQPLIDTKNKLFAPADQVNDRGRRAAGHDRERRVSRSLSPGTVRSTSDYGIQEEPWSRRRSVSPSKFGRLDDDRQRTLVLTTPHQSPQPTSLVSDLLTMFSGPSREDDKHMSLSARLHGSVTVYAASIIPAVMPALGGLRVWFPLLIIDRSRQIASLRIIANLIIHTKSVFDEFLQRRLDHALLFCFYVTPSLLCSDSMQILFDMAVSSNHRVDTLRHVCFLELITHVATLSCSRIRICRSTIEWITTLCDDNVDHASKFLESVGLSPVATIMSLWTTCNKIQQIVSAGSRSNVVYPPHAYDGSKKFSVTSVPSVSAHVLSKYKLQLACAKLLKVLITGSSGELPVQTIPTAVATPTGFNASHLLFILNFIQAAVARAEMKGGKGDVASLGRFPIAAPDLISGNYDKRGPSAQAWLLNSAQLALDCVIDCTEGALSAVMMNLFRAAMPGNGMWAMIFDLLACRHTAIRSRALHLLGYSLSGLDGQLDQRLVQQFDRLQGFSCIVERLSGNKHRDDAEELYDTLLSLIFWRRQVIPSQHLVTPGSRPTSNRINRLDVIDEVESVGTERSRKNTYVEEDGIDSPSDLFTDEPVKQLPPHEKPQDADIEAQISTMHEVNDVPMTEQPHGTGSNTSSSFEQKTQKIELIVLPQLLPCFYKLFESETSPERIHSVMTQLEDCLMGSEADMTLRNMESITSQREWLLWNAECLLALRRRISTESNMDILSENESMGDISGVESDESVDNIYEPNLTRAERQGIEKLESFSGPILGLLQTIFKIDIVMRPHHTRRIYDILRLPCPEANEVQLTILYDLLDTFENSPMMSAEVSLNVLRNLASFLDQALERIDLNLDFVLRAILVMNALTFHVPTEARGKIKDTLLPDVRNNYVTQCLIDKTENIVNRISALTDIHSSIQNLLVCETKAISEYQVLILMFGFFVEASEHCNEISDDEECKVMMDMQFAVLVLIQNCAQNSSEFRKHVNKFVGDVEGVAKEKKSVLVQAFTNQLINYKARCASPMEKKELPQQPPVTPVAQKSWWGSWSAPTEAEDALMSPSEDVISVVKNNSNSDMRSSTSETMKPRMSEESVPTDTVTFLDWYNSSAQRDMVEALQKKVQRELQIVLRQTEKMQEKLSQRRGRNMKQLQDKLAKDKIALQKTVKETLQKSHMLNDKGCVKYEAEQLRCIQQLYNNLAAGEKEFIKTYTQPDENASENAVFDESSTNILATDSSLTSPELWVLENDAEAVSDKRELYDYVLRKFEYMKQYV